MADTHDSGSCALTGMGVQVPLSAPGVAKEDSPGALCCSGRHFTLNIKRFGRRLFSTDKGILAISLECVYEK